VSEKQKKAFVFPNGSTFNEVKDTNKYLPTDMIFVKLSIFRFVHIYFRKYFVSL